MQRIFHTPEGVRDIYNGECSRKHQLQSRIRQVFLRYGYEEIETPTFEFFEVFSREVGTIPSKDLYKFFDREGNTLVLRPDFTPSVSRACATYFSPDKDVVTLSYTGQAFTNSSSYQGRLKETTQMGVERIGDSSAEADAELLAMTVECLLESGLKEFQVSVGNVEFFQSLIEDACLDEDARERVIELISNKNYFGVEEYLDSIQVKRSSREAFVSLGELVGGVEVLSRARDIAPNSAGIMAVKRLERLYNILKLYGVEKFITFDLGMTVHYGYYTGIIFRGYTYGTGDAIVKGGRYDHLLEKFGKNSPSIGFAIVIDELMNAMTRQKLRIVYTRKNNLILYDEGKEQAAIALARDFRHKAKNTELLRKEKNRLLEEYVAYGREYYAGNLIYIRKSGEILMVNLVSGEQKVIENKRTEQDL